MDTFTVLDLLDLDLIEHDALELKCLAGRPGLSREITVPDLNRPGLALAGFFDKFAYNRIQVFGRGETAFLDKLHYENNIEAIHEMFTYPIPCCVFSHELTPHEEFIENAEEAGVPILQTTLATADFSSRVIRALDAVFAQQKVVHASLVEVFGIGILIMGDSGVGKSETALELIERGHRLICDDAVEIRCVSGNILMGSAFNKVTSHHMEIRGLGIINVAHLFGVGAIRDKKQVQLVVHLENWDSSKAYDRLGSADEKEEILGVHVPSIFVPVKPGRNNAILIEVASMVERLKKMGYHSAKEFDQNVLDWLESENARALYFQKEDKF
jgi:HPr kinase/phosphorylase